jgi:EAL domain-containing protein (putative c-di-GMP-specific phosphodiesterase class I)
LGPVGFSAGYDILNDPNDVYEKAALDLRVLEHAATDSKTLARTKARSRITIPVHFSTLTQDQKGKEYLQKCRAFFGSNTNAISFEIVGLPERLAEYNFGSLVWQLRSITPYINARVTIDRSDFVDLRIAGVRGVCVDLYDDFRNEHQLLERLDRFTSTAHKEGLKTCISGIRTISLNTAAISCGADFVGGYPVSNTTQTINYMKAFDIQRKYHTDIHAA